MCMLMFIPTYGILLLIRFFAVITKYSVLDEQRREAKEGKSQHKNPHSITRGAMLWAGSVTCSIPKRALNLSRDMK